MIVSKPTAVSFLKNQRRAGASRFIPPTAVSIVDNIRSNTAVTSVKPKEEVIKDMGFTKIQVSRFETLADKRLQFCKGVNNTYTLRISEGGHLK